METRIDILEDFVCCSENQRYNKEYQHWRRHTNTPFMYRYSGDANENIYVEGGTQQKTSAAASERQALTHCGDAVGMAMLLFLLAELIGRPILTALLRLFGVQIHMDFIAQSTPGSQWAETGAQIFIILLKFGLPAVILLHFCKIPRKIAAPVLFGGIPETIAAVGFGMLIACIHSLTAHSEDVELVQRMFNYKDIAAVVAFAAFDIFLTPILAELLLRGCILQLLRQFGDGFAIAVTACIAFLCPNTLPDRISALLIGLASGYLMLRSGSILKCIIIRVIYTTMVYARLILVSEAQRILLWQYTLLLASAGMLAIAAYAQVRRGKIRLEQNQTVLEDREKLFALTQSVAALPWLAIAALLTLVQLFY